MASFRSKKPASIGQPDQIKQAKIEKKVPEGSLRELFKRLEPDQLAQTGIFRHTVLLIDSSDSLPLDYLSEFVNTLFLYLQFTLSHYPLIRVACMTLQNSRCYLELQFMSNISAFEEVLRDGFRPSGHIALATGLDQAYELLMDHKSMSSLQQILYFNFSSGTMDSMNIFAVIEKLKAANIKVSVVSLTNSFGVLDYIAKQTGGRHLIADKKIKGGLLNVLKSLDLQCSQIEQCEALAPEEGAKEKEGGRFLLVGFPVHLCDDAICFCHNRHGTGYYECPFCCAIMCDISECVCCGLQLVMYPNLYRSALLHKKSLSLVQRITKNSDPEAGEEVPSKKKNICTLCKMAYGTESETVSYVCTICETQYCRSCSELLSEAKVECPACILKD